MRCALVSKSLDLRGYFGAEFAHSPIASRSSIIALGACPSNRRIFLAKEVRVGFCLCA